MQPGNINSEDNKWNGEGKSEEVSQPSKIRKQD